MLTLKSCLIGVALFFTTAVAYAEDAVKPYPECSHQPTEGDVNGAKGAFQAGQASFNEADYKRAIDYWEDAYRRDCTAHDLLQNLARAYELDNQKRHAVNALETYLARNPSSPQRDQIAKRIEVLNEKIAKEDSTAGTPPSGPSDPGGGPVTPPPGGDQKPDDTTGGKRPITPLIVAGAGGVLTILGTVLYLKASGDVKDAEDACGGRKECPNEIADKGNSGRTRQRIWGGVTIVGLAAAIGGTIWYLTSSPAPAKASTTKSRRFSRSPRVEPLVGSGFAGLGVSGAF